MQIPNNSHPSDPPRAGEEDEDHDAEMHNHLGAQGLDRDKSVPPPSQGPPLGAGGTTRREGTQADLGEHTECHGVPPPNQGPLPGAGSTAHDEGTQADLGEHAKRHVDLGSNNPADNAPNLLPNLCTTQRYIDALRLATLGDSGMEQEDIENLQRPGPVDNLDDPSPLLRSLWHFVNNDLASRDHYDTTRCIELLNDPDSVFLSYDQVSVAVAQATCFF
jgi:hypothetical protein